MVSRGVVSEFNGVDAAHSHQHNHHQGLLVKSAVPSTNKGKPMWMPLYCAACLVHRPQPWYAWR